MTLLELQDLTTFYKIRRGYVRAAENISFSVNQGEAVGLAGESGCGKTTLALSVLRILPPGGIIMGGKILFDDVDILTLNEREMREKIRWKKMSLVFQGAMNALNPVYKVGDQIVEAITTHEADIDKSEAMERTKKLLGTVGIEPSRVDNYPHEFSGGMKQRSVIAMALACNPKLLIADEPGTALDVIVQAQILKLLIRLRQELNLSMILITHDLSIIAETCQKVAIMYAGRLVEFGDAVTIFKEPVHPYTQGLMSAFPDIAGPRTRMKSIPGSPPDLLCPPIGCHFHPRCKYALDICRKEEPIFTCTKKNHYVACHLVQKS